MQAAEADWGDDDQDDEDWEGDSAWGAQAQVADLKSRGLLWDCRNCTLRNLPSEAAPGSSCQSCGCGWVDWKKSGPPIAPTLTGTERQRKSKPAMAWAYDERMLQHREMPAKGGGGLDEIHPERPDRVRAIYEHLTVAGLLSTSAVGGEVIQLPSREATREEVELVHTRSHCDAVDRLAELPPGERLDLPGGDTFACRESPLAARLSAGAVVDTTVAVAQGKARTALAIARPPGHHAEAGVAQARKSSGDPQRETGMMGFCLYNNVGVAVKVAQQRQQQQQRSHMASGGGGGSGAGRVMRVLVLDWDVHHGNGTQNMFDDDPSVLYISLHRFDPGFYPGTGAPEEVGTGTGAGFNMNVAWGGPGHGDAEYLAAFHHLILPAATAFRPELVVISAGFDAAAGDPLGGCNITPAGYRACAPCNPCWPLPVAVVIACYTHVCDSAYWLQGCPTCLPA